MRLQWLALFLVCSFSSVVSAQWAPGTTPDSQYYNGNVGIGTDAPATRLDVRGPAQSIGQARTLLLVRDTTPAAAGVGGGIGFSGYFGLDMMADVFAGIWGFKANSTSGDYGGGLAFATRANGGIPTERMRIGSDGRVGIGVTDPKALLHAGGSSTVPQLLLSGPTNGVLSGLAYQEDNVSLAFDARWESQWLLTHATAAWLYKSGNRFRILGRTASQVGTAFQSHMDVDLQTGNIAFGSAPAASGAHFYFARANDPLMQIGDASTRCAQGASNCGPGLTDRYLYLRYLIDADHAVIGGYRSDGGARPLVLQNYGGNVGIGVVPPPAHRLHVAGNFHATGSITADGSVQSKYQDLAEWVPASVDMTPGTVVVLDPAYENRVMPSSNAYDTTVAGVVSLKPGILLGEESATKEAVATTGRVLVRVDATKSPIRIGDLLVTSGTPGVAMKSEPMDLGGRKLHQPGTIIGKALQPLQSGAGEILVLLSLQ